MKKILFTAFSLALSFAPSANANAAIRVYRISDGKFDDGAAFSGSFSFNDVSNIYSNVNISVGDGVLRAFDYGPTSIVSINPFSANSLVVVAPFGVRYFQLVFSSSLAGTTGSTALKIGRTADSNYSYECDNCRVLRAVTGGFVTVAAVPEPSTWLSMLMGFGMVGATARYRRRATKIAYA